MSTESELGVSLRLPFPFGSEQVFRYRAMEDILECLVRNPFRSFPVTRLQELTDNGAKTTGQAVDLLQDLDLVRVEARGNRKEVGLNRDRVTIPDDPLFAIPQDEFREPVRAFAERAREEIPAFAGLVVFGSVARGDADRASDIDCWVLIEDDDELLAARRVATELAAEMGTVRFNTGTDTFGRKSDRYAAETRGDRYEFEPLVESVDSALDHGNRLREILLEGVVLVDSDALRRVKDAVLDGMEVES
jgi:predicted nucleotidyltransferase